MPPCIRCGAWHGWPVFICGDPITDPAAAAVRPGAPFLLADHAGLPPPE
ncbi:MAG: hypothetical protein IRY87_01495 [Acetobacteraceae bacterium]|nr:hypothetical protein [Acetobacteraceae bacterium]